MQRILAIALCGALSASACAADPQAPAAPTKPDASAAAKPDATAAAQPESAGTEASIRKAIGTLAPDAKVERVRPSALPGVSEVSVDGGVVYMSNDGRYLIRGSLYDTRNNVDLTEASRAAVRKVALDALDKSQMIVFSPAKPTDTVTVFTDIDCGYCQKLHLHMAEYNKQGIAVQYLFYPRTGIGTESFDKAVSVWCAADRRAALTRSKAGQSVPKSTCKNPVTLDYALGQKLGIEGTPAIFAPDGSLIGGYLTPEQLRAKLDALKGKPAA